jgi:hypothetical protein
VVEIEVFYSKDTKSSIGGADGAVDNNFGGDKTCRLGADIEGVVNSVTSNCVSYSSGIGFVWPVCAYYTKVSGFAASGDLFTRDEKYCVSAWCILVALC